MPEANREDTHQKGSHLRPDNNNSPQGFPAFGLSDHNTIVAFPKNLSQRINTKKVVTIRDKRTSGKAEMGRYLAAVDWS